MNHLGRILPPLLIVGLAIVLATQGITLAQDQPQLTSVYYPAPLPLADPLDSLWDDVPALTVALTPQLVSMPTLAEVTVSQVTVRSVNDGRWISFLMTWDDPTPNMSATRPDEFRDAAAIQLPVGDTIPSLCMGAIGQLAKIWHWKADWQADIDHGFRDVVDAYPNFWSDHYPFVRGEPPFKMPDDFAASDARSYLVGWAAGNPLSQPERVSPVEVVKAYGFGTVTHNETQDVLGRGVWQDGTWHVVFSRPLVSSEIEGVNFTPGETISLAFAVWNGENREVGARKQLSAWVPMLVESATQPAAPEAPRITEPAPSGIQPAFVIGGLLLAVALTALITMLATGGLRRST